MFYNVISYEKICCSYIRSYRFCKSITTKTCQFYIVLFDKIPFTYVSKIQSYSSIFSQGLTAEDECTPCVGGMACDVQGMDTPIRPCSAGYYCRLGANSTTAELGVNADICPPGSYCPEGTDEPVPCPEGSYSPQEGLHWEYQCLNCTGGYFCNITGWLVFDGRTFV